MSEPPDKPNPPAGGLDDAAPPTAMSLRRKLLFASATGALLLFAGLVACEFYCRLMIPLDDDGWYELTGDPILFYRPTADLEYVDRSKRRTHTSQHLRGPLVFEADPPADTYRVAWVGDSACFGAHLADDETAPFQLHLLAREKGLELDSINLGVVGYNVRQARELVQVRAREFHGLNAIIYYHHENDIINATWAGSLSFMPAELYWKFERPGNPVARWLKRSALAARIARTDLVNRWLRGRRPDPRSQGADGNPAKAQLAPITAQCVALYTEQSRFGLQFRDELHAMADQAAAQGARFMMLYFPTRSLLGHEQLGQLRSVLAKWCAEKDITLIDMTEDFLANRGLDLYADHLHPGTLGQRLIARRVFEELPLE